MQVVLYALLYNVQRPPNLYDTDFLRRTLNNPFWKVVEKK